MDFISNVIFYNLDTFFFSVFIFIALIVLVLAELSTPWYFHVKCIIVGWLCAFVFWVWNFFNWLDNEMYLSSKYPTSFASYCNFDIVGSGLIAGNLPQQIRQIPPLIKRENIGYMLETMESRLNKGFFSDATKIDTIGDILITGSDLTDTDIIISKQSGVNCTMKITVQKSNGISEWTWFIDTTPYIQSLMDTDMKNKETEDAQNADFSKQQESLKKNF